jgi:hypothetical protein
MADSYKYINFKNLQVKKIDIALWRGRFFLRELFPLLADRFATFAVLN